MARNWITVRVQLLGGRDIVCDPPPGRIMLVGPRHTFADLAEAVDAAFARWDLSHLHAFELADGRSIGEPEPELEFEDERALVVAATVTAGEPFVYVFDFGDDWRHACVVEETGVDPIEAYGVVPKRPVPIWGWGWIPDQYGRRSENDTGEDETELD